MKALYRQVDSNNRFVLQGNMSEVLVKCVYKVPAMYICALLPPSVVTVNCSTAAYFLFLY